ncbi:MAG: 4Fe-4S binding protein [Tannerella sp.]|jgi:polyferredoxin|nr:4Fe-4S binding protein [Tannerella sp.]
MKPVHTLKVWRVTLAILFFSPLLIFFTDFTGKLPERLHLLAHIQLIPAVLAGVYGIVAALLTLTFLFGRIYCSVICPAGILQDLMNRISRMGRKRKKKQRHFRYHKPQNVLRYLLLAVTTLPAAFGVTELCLLLDPYSNFGRIAVHFFRPVVMEGNNLLAAGLSKTGNYALYHISVNALTTGALTAAGIALTVFAVMSFRRGRLFCNTLCPVGALLSVVSRHAIFRITVDKKTCTRCRACEHACKAEAIDPDEGKVDGSRCVGCFNCLSSCRKKALAYRPSFRRSAAPQLLGTEATGVGRRMFLGTGAAVVASLSTTTLKAWTGVGRRQRRKGQKNRLPILPPGALNLTHFTDKCTACHLCVTKCPSHVLRPAGMEYGLDYLLKPHMAYIDSYCNFECVICSQVCPTHAIRPLTVEAKKTAQIGIVRFYTDLCVVHTEEKDCGACSEHCPTQAVHMVPYKGTLTIPQVETELCVGCGGCESICPVRPGRAIIVEAHEIHQIAEKPKEEKALDVKVDEFGF